MNTKHKSRLVYLLAALLTIAVLAYNFWSYSLGYCTVTSLMAFSAPARLLLGGIAVAIIYLWYCKSQNRQLMRLNTCACCAELRDTWVYCPVCGQRRKNTQADISQ